MQDEHRKILISIYSCIHLPEIGSLTSGMHFNTVKQCEELSNWQHIIIIIIIIYVYQLKHVKVCYSSLNTSSWARNCRSLAIPV
jgi:uncharacterized protein (DUF983 family)